MLTQKLLEFALVGAGRQRCARIVSLRG